MMSAYDNFGVRFIKYFCLFVCIFIGAIALYNFILSMPSIINVFSEIFGSETLGWYILSALYISIPSALIAVYLATLDMSDD